MASSSFGSLVFVHEDVRRSIHEINLPNSAVQKFTVKDGKLPLGNHYHKEKEETFVVLEGAGIFYSCPVDENGLALISEPIVNFLKKESVIHVPAFVAHAFDLKKGTTLLCYSSTPFKGEGFDFYSYKLID